MYAISENLTESWAALYAAIAPELKALYREIGALRFDTSDAALMNPRLLIGQTCGFPLVTRYRDILSPVCVAHFDVAGCRGPQYSSAIVVSVASNIKTLADACGQTAVINSRDSNSGMNVFRALLTHKRESRQPYFSRTYQSGSHLESLRAVAQREADIASIDCVTLAYLQAALPDLLSRVRVIQHTEHSMGLPFVVTTHREQVMPRSLIVDLLNSGLATLNERHRNRLRIKKFSEVTVENYLSIAEIDKTARSAGHQAEHL